jgi:hypothetical protein
MFKRLHAIYLDWEHGNRYQRIMKNRSWIEKHFPKDDPPGLIRHGETGSHFINGKIVVSKEWMKDQLILASKHIHDLDTIDTDIVAANWLAHLYTTPEFIEVQS